MSLCGPKDTGDASVRGLGGSVFIGSSEINIMTAEC